VARFIIRYRGRGPKPADVVEKIRDLSSVSIVDASDKMLLVEAPEESLKQLLGQSKEWLIAPEQSYEIPEKRPRSRPA
jgi:hypothetical protein